MSASLGLREALQACGLPDTPIDDTALLDYLECVDEGLVAGADGTCVIASEMERVANGVAACIRSLAAQAESGDSDDDDDDSDSDDDDYAADAAAALEAFADYMGVVTENENCGNAVPFSAAVNVAAKVVDLAADAADTITDALNEATSGEFDPDDVPDWVSSVVASYVGATLADMVSGNTGPLSFLKRLLPPYGRGIGLG